MKISKKSVLVFGVVYVAAVIVGLVIMCRGIEAKITDFEKSRETQMQKILIRKPSEIILKVSRFDHRALAAGSSVDPPADFEAYLKPSMFVTSTDPQVRAERERIARDLHDLLGHSLSMITLKSELAGKLVNSSQGLAHCSRPRRSVRRSVIIMVKVSWGGSISTSYSTPASCSRSTDG